MSGLEEQECERSPDAPTRGATDIFNKFGYDVTPDDVAKLRAALAEFIGMTLFVWVGCGVAVSLQSAQTLHPDSELQTSFVSTVGLAFGLAIAVLVYTIAPVSGGHLNPAVTLAFVIMGQMSIATGACYMLAQCLGALLGASLVWGSMASNAVELVSGGGEKVPPFNLGSNFVAEDLPLGSAFLGEAIGTFLLVWTVIRTAVEKTSIAGNLAPIAIGWSVVLAHFVLIPLTGCGINPARSFGPHLVIIMAGEKAGTEGWWVYYTAPFVGSTFAVLVCKYVFSLSFDEDEEEGAKAEAKEQVEEQAPKCLELDM